MNKKILERLWRPVLIVLLLISAFFLASATGYYDGLVERFHSGAVNNSNSSVGTGLMEGVRSVHPLAVVVCEKNGAVSASAYDGERTEEAFGRFSAFLGEALGSAGEPQKIYEWDFRSGMDAGCVIFTFHCPQNLGMLSHWLGTEMSSSAAGDSADILYLRLFEDETLFCYRDESGMFYRCTTAAQSEALGSRLQGGVSDMSAEFAYRTDDLKGVFPYTVIFGKIPVIYGLEGSSAVEALNHGELMDALGMNSYVASSYRESDGTRVFIDAEQTLRITPDGSISYHGQEPESRLALERQTTLNMAFSLAERSIGAYAGAAKYFFAGEIWSDDSCTVYFDYCVNEIPVALGGGHAAEITLRGGTVTDFSARLLHFALQETEETVLPMRQAAAIAGAKGGGMPALAYAEQKGGFSAAWINK